jgi:hypothetical protein
MDRIKRAAVNRNALTLFHDVGQAFLTVLLRYRKSKSTAVGPVLQRQFNYIQLFTCVSFA